MISVSSREVEKFRSFLSQQSIFREIGSVTTRSQNDRTVSLSTLVRALASTKEEKEEHLWLQTRVLKRERISIDRGTS